MDIKTIRQQMGITQKEASELTNIPLRTYKTYENDPSKVGTIKYDYIVNVLKEKSKVDEEHGILLIENIQRTCKEVFQDKAVSFCILFGSYAKGTATEKSDIDLLISTDIHGLQYFGLVEELRERLSKKVDVLDISQLSNSPELLDNILREGIRIYVKG